LRHTAELHIVE